MAKSSSTTMESRKGGISRYVDNQIKNIIAMGGGVFESVKAIKAVYAALQSISPNDFPLQWDVVFFSIYSRKLISELSFLILEKGEIEEVLWRKKGSCHPFHHIYLLTKKGRRTITTSFYKDYNKPYYSDLIVWSLLKPKFPVYWAYFLEMLTYHEMTESEKMFPFLPTLENHEQDESQRKHLQRMRDGLCQRLKELNISRLSIIKPSYAEKNNLYLFLPFGMDDTRRDKFLEFYKSGRHNEYVNIQESQKKEEPNLLDVKINPDGVADKIYNYIHLEKEEIQKELSNFDIPVKQFGQLVHDYTHQLCERIPNDNEDGLIAYYRILEAANNRREFLNNIPRDLKEKVVKRGKELLSALNDFYELAEWRYNNIITMLCKLAKVSQKVPINLFFGNYTLEGYLNEVCVEQQTMIGFEFSDEFRVAYEEEFGYKMPSESLHHVCHFVQPGEALKAIYNHKENCLLNGGPVIGEY